LIEGRKVVVCTPAGRREHLEILVPYVLRDRGIIDQYQLWLNTEEEEDIAYIRRLAATFPDFIKIVERDPEIPLDPIQKGYSIHQFFRGCVEPGTVYVRLDDDVLFVDEGAIEGLVRFRIESPGYFLVYGNIINNAICSHLHQRAGVIDNQRGLAGYWCLDKVAWEDPEFAEYTHRWFFHHYQEGKHRKFNCFDRWELNCNERVSINVVSWLGEDFGAFGGEVGVDEEWWLSQSKPLSLSRMNCIYGKALFAHYSFYNQKSHMDSTNVHNLYKQVSELETRQMPDQDKLFNAINVLLSAPLNKLREVDFLEHMVRMAGLFPDGRGIYGPENNEYQNQQMGAWQNPRELAEFMVYLQGFRIESYLDIGTFYGWTCSLISAVLVRFNPEIKVTAIDPQVWWSTYPQIANVLPIRYLQETSDSLVGQKFDFVFIDGNHEYSASKRDFENVGRLARICALHDANDDYIRGCPYQAGGVTKLWDELKAQMTHREFFASQHGMKFMGIGVLVNVGASQ
jgi:hypothetical protein